MKFYIEISEILRRVVEIEAESKEKAVDYADTLYQTGEIVLDGDDYLEASSKIATILISDDEADFTVIKGKYNANDSSN